MAAVADPPETLPPGRTRPCRRPATPPPKPPRGGEAAALAVASSYARQAHAPATLRAYAADWADFTAWCRSGNLTACPATPAAVAAYLASLASTHGRSALERRLAAIGYQHRLRGAEWHSTRRSAPPCAASSAPMPAAAGRPPRSPRSNSAAARRLRQRSRRHPRPRPAARHVPGLLRILEPIRLALLFQGNRHHRFGI